jgi:hypothetical protein
MSERRRRKNPRFLKETSDRSGFDSWSQSREGNFLKQWTGIKQSGLLIEPIEFDMPPPSNRSLGGADISGTPRANGEVINIDSSSVAQVQYVNTASQIYLTQQIAIYIAGSNSNITLSSATQVAQGGSNQVIAIMCVDSGVTVVNGNGLTLNTSSYYMDSGAILNLIYNGSTWQETSRSHMYYSLGAL